MKIQAISYHMLLEFTSFLHNLAYFEDEFSKLKEDDKPEASIRDMIESTISSLSPTLRSDLNLFIRDTDLYFTFLVSHEVIDTYVDFSALQNAFDIIDADMIISQMLSHSELMGIASDGRSAKSEEEKIVEIEKVLTQMDQEAHVLESYRELRNYPEDTMARFKSFLNRMYSEHFQAFESEIEINAKEKAAHHQKLYDQDPDKFLDLVMKVNFNQLGQEIAKLKLCVGWLNCDKIAYSVDKQTLLAHYTHTIEETLDPNYLRKQEMKFFKALSDETRLDMLHKLAEKNYYSKELADALEINKATVSYHMKSLIRFNIIDITLGESRRIYYRLNKEKLKNLFDRFLGTFPDE
jgi:DNA-binding transcriptional ArsR family regulator